MMMVLCNVMSMPVDDDASSSSNGGGAAGSAKGRNHPHMPKVRCNAMEWTDETEEGGQLKVLVMRSDLTVAGTTVVVTELQAIPRAPLTETAAERRYKERKWC
jgi:hypothetical protein